MILKICNTTISSLLSGSLLMTATQNQLKIPDMVECLQGIIPGALEIPIKILKLMFAVMKSLACLKTRKAHVFLRYIQIILKTFKHTRKSSTAWTKNLSSKEITTQSVHGELNYILRNVAIKLFCHKELVIQSKKLQSIFNANS